jgi:hypothetical protein
MAHFAHVPIQDDENYQRPLLLEALMLVLCILFVSEVSLRMYALGLGCDDGQYFDFHSKNGTGFFNVIDLVVTLIDVLTIVLENALAGDATGTLKISNALRVLRFVRLVRVMRLVKYKERFVLVTYFKVKGSHLLHRRVVDKSEGNNEERSDHYAFGHGLKTMLASFMPGQFILHTARVFTGWDMDQSSGHEQDFLHFSARIPPWNFKAIRQILVKRRSALTVYIFFNVLTLINTVGSMELSSVHECKLGSVNSFDWSYECALHQQWVLQCCAFVFLIIALFTALFALVSWHNLAVSQKYVRYMALSSLGVLYILSLWPLSSSSATATGAATALLSGFFSGVMTLVNISLSALAISAAMTRACRQMRDLFPNAELVTVVELFIPLVCCAPCNSCNHNCRANRLFLYRAGDYPCELGVVRLLLPAIRAIAALLPTRQGPVVLVLRLPARGASHTHCAQHLEHGRRRTAHTRAKGSHEFP